MKYGIGKFEGVYKRAKEIVLYLKYKFSKILLMIKCQLRHFK